MCYTAAITISFQLSVKSAPAGLGWFLLTRQIFTNVMEICENYAKSLKIIYCRHSLNLGTHFS